MLSFFLQMLFDSKRELRCLWDIPGMLLVPSARSEQQDVILCFEIFDQSSAFCRDEADVSFFEAAMRFTYFSRNLASFSGMHLKQSIGLT